MNPQAIQVDTARVSGAALIERARALVPLLRAHAAEAEAARRISDDVIEEMQRADLFRLMQPARYGGFEFGFDDLVLIAGELGRASGSAAWVYSVLAFHNWQVGLFPLEGQDELWADSPRALIASSYMAAGRGTPGGGGFRLSGKWGFSSGCDNAQWLILGGRVEDPHGAVELRWFLVPRAEVVIDDNWHVAGLSGTGSKNIVVEDKFVPERRTLKFSEAIAGAAPGSRVHANPLYRIPFFAVASYCLIAPGLGVAQGALDDYVAQTLGRSARGPAALPGGARVIDFVAVQMRVSEAAGLIDAARLLLLRGCQATQAQVAAGGDLPLVDRARNKRDQALAMRFLKDAVRLVFEAAGGAGLFADNPLQRASRDIHAIGCHLTLNWDAVMPVYGRILFGLEPGMPL